MNDASKRVGTIRERYLGSERQRVHVSRVADSKDLTTEGAHSLDSKGNSVASSIEQEKPPNEEGTIVLKRFSDLV